MNTKEKLGLILFILGCFALQDAIHYQSNITSLIGIIAMNGGAAIFLMCGNNEPTN